MAEYNFREIEQKWQKNWKEKQVFKTGSDTSKPKFYALDMFPYPSGAGLHVGHPLGYIASDIVSRYKRMQGFNVLHPMGFDSFGLPAEQYAIQTGQHPAITTDTNIKRYKEQLENIGFSYDWEREVRTSDPSFYKWTQWIFKQLFNSWYNRDTDKAEPIAGLIAKFETEGNGKVNAVCDDDTALFTATDWKAMSEADQQRTLLKYRLTYINETTVNWCPALGTVLSNDEVKDGFSERGGHPVIKKKMPQWSMRITAYADRLLEGLDRIDWPEPIKEMQRNWIGKSIGAEVDFKIENSEKSIRVFTTRIDTIYGVTFMVLAPEADIVKELTTTEQKAEVEQYVEVAKNRSERDRMSDVKTVSGVFTGSYVINPFSGERVPIYIADYVLAGYGTGAVMAVPSGDQRDFNFAKHFGLPITQIIDEQKITDTEADPTKQGKMVNSGMLNGLTPLEAIEKAGQYVEEKGIGVRKVNFRMRDAIFGRQRYWGEPLPVYFKDGIPYLLEDNELPLELPDVDKFLPTEDGEPPLGRAKDFKTQEGHPYELTTMPGWAGSSWYFFRYMDPSNEKEFCSKEAQEYWQSVDLYIGGSEHATGHLLYSRFWTKFLYDLGLVTVDEYATKLVNQGMIQGRSNFVYRVKGENKFVSHGLKGQYDTVDLHVDVNIVTNDVLDIEAYKKFNKDAATAEFVLEGGKYICGWEVEKMSKSKYNVVNPDDMIEKYGADTLRLYEMFLGPLEQFKPWNTHGIDGVFKFLRKTWRLFHDDKGELSVSSEKPTADELKVLHKTIKKMADDVDKLSFNTSVSSFMICVNELTDLKCNKKEILGPLTQIIAPYAPHIAEELWEKLGNTESITYSKFPEFNPEFVKEDAFEYPISINGKMRHKMSFSADASPAEVEKAVLADENVQKWIEGKAPKKVIVVPKRIVNIVL
ncbi:MULTISPECIES: leucine--tRNA ligase [unclassified Imperialibacter]|uniref:leucine--tRNA ligase n=1 Tax=unclassified Imperialibacter TaxID=2629706 RepID=UPI001251FABC|nr:MULTISPECIES: leucine--tRNA ligase [unclassified Imperialibacter]CAD5258264.1 Leucine--tRNA ligase [Imperialibacter sp. 75]CAD5261354.1 Leucine--tRNA ligase [Imperialibacter sp. 89]VVT24848.1 Leucine--tRNA ligase [Imperialibacter sp. EC-SDR9]